MKNTSLKFLTFASVAALAAAGTGCAKIDDFGTTNDNPNAVTTPITAALLTNAEASLRTVVNGTRTVLYCQYVSETQYTDASLYALPQLEYGPTYSGPLYDLQSIINRNTDPATAGVVSASGGNANQIAIAKILKSYYFWTITDRWGDVPYSEALQGAANKTPKFDAQLDIYKGMLKDLKDAIAGFDAGANMQGDIIYGGDNAKWKKLANSLRMLMALRLTKVYPNAGDFAATEFAAAYNNIAVGYIATNADNARLVPPGSAYRHPWYDIYFTRDDYGLSKTMTDALAGLGDTRVQAFGGNYSTPGPNALGFPYGLTRDLAVAFTNLVGGNHARVLELTRRLETSPVVIVNASTVLLAAAEAIERGWVTGNAETMYNNAITQSFGEWNIAVPAGYLAGPANFNTGAGVAAIGQFAAPYDAIPASQNAATPTKLKRIQLQRWIAAFPNGNEGWAEWRRTAVPDLKPTRFATNSSKAIPRRYVYGTSEYSLNPAQLAVAIANLPGGDTQDSKVWWDRP